MEKRARKDQVKLASDLEKEQFFLFFYRRLVVSRNKKKRNVFAVVV